MPAPTAEQLQAAFAQHRRPTWPCNADAALADPLIRRLLAIRIAIDRRMAERAERRGTRPAPQLSLLDEATQERTHAH